MDGKDKKLVVIGSSGQLGGELCKLIPKKNLVALTHKDIEVTREIKPFKERVVINCAAYHDVNGCEDNPKKAFQVNSLGAYNVAKASSVVIYISTDYVFGNTKKRPYLEGDSPNPLNVYGASKLAGENLVRIANPNHFIIRTSALYGGVSRKGWTFPDMMIEKAMKGENIKVVNDLFTGTTYVKDLAKEILKLVKTKKYGTYHMVNKGGASWYQFAKEVFRLKGLKPNFKAVSFEELPSLVVRPKYSVLGSGKIVLREWREALRDYLT
tara:strand:- start:680 stop:1483 length:804 start_codon:yes stop_codon:yes gene_type:complete